MRTGQNALETGAWLTTLLGPHHIAPLFPPSTAPSSPRHHPSYPELLQFAPTSCQASSATWTSPWQPAHSPAPEWAAGHVPPPTEEPEVHSGVSNVHMSGSLGTTYRLHSAFRLTRNPDFLWHNCRLTLLKKCDVRQSNGRRCWSLLLINCHGINNVLQHNQN